MNLVYQSTFPVCFLSESTLLIFKRGDFSILNLSDGNVSNIGKFKTSLSDTLLSRIPLVARILRKGVRCGIKVSENLVLIVIGQRIYELDLVKGKVSDGFITPNNSRPLSFSRIEGIKECKDGIYFGGYKGNPNKKPISIYRRIMPDQWEEVYQFPKNTIEHIHNIVADPYKNIVYVLTGDFDHSAGIWMTDNGFETVVPLLIGDQKFRGCIAFATQEGLIYATDSPFQDNSIRLLKENSTGWESSNIHNINGPSIYGCQWGKDYVFSTSVEDDGRNIDFWYKLFGKTKGEGIIESYSFIYKGNLQDGFKQIYKIKKDKLPFYLFQFGVLIFPSELNNSIFLPVFHIATTRYGMSTILLKSTNI